MSDSVTGGCLCGAVRYRAALPTLFCAHCHCRYCRRAHGAAFITWFGVPDDKFEITAGDRELQWHASSKQSRRGFCSRCGTTLLFVSECSPGETHIGLATADGPIDRQPQRHVFWDHRVDWYEPDDDLPRLTSDSAGLAKYRNVED